MNTTTNASWRDAPASSDELHSLGLDAATAAWLSDSAAGPGGSRPMRVVAVQRGNVLLHDGRQPQPARLAPALARGLADDDDGLAVGDWVLADIDDWHQLWVRHCMPQRNAVTRRRAQSGREDHSTARRQVLVSNVDTALLVMGLDHDFNPRRLERYLALAQLAGIEPVLVLTKADLADEARRARCVAAAREVLPADAAVVAVDGRDASAASGLAPWLAAGRTLVLLGSSGAGKSTLTNTLTGQAVGGAGWRAGGDNPAGQRTGAARDDDSRGRHTTTVRSLHRIPGGACIIDTPGLRALRLDVESEDDLAEAFGDVARLAPLCRFADCRHQQEPGCAVRAGLPEARLRNYHKLLREAQRDGMSVLERREERARWKARGREGLARLRAKQSF